MKQYFVMAVLAVTLGLGGCASTITVKPISEVKFWPKPTKEEAVVKIKGFLKNVLIDPYSAVVECNDLSDEAWVWPGYGYPPQYGYLVLCNVNAKNRFGGYVGAKRYWFRINGEELEHHEYVPSMGLMKKQKMLNIKAITIKDIPHDYVCHFQKRLVVTSTQ